MKKVLIDCRYLGMSGMGRFLENILDSLDYSKFKYTLLGKKEKISQYKNVNYIYDDLSPFSSKSLFKTNTKEINKNDVFFTPNFIIPFGIKTKIISVLHDIIFLDMPEVNKNYVEFRIKKYLLRRCMIKSSKVFTVSEFSKNRIAYFFPKYKSKIEFQYQGITSKFKGLNLQVEKDNSIIYVGNIKKHKGLSILLDSFELIHKENDAIKLYIVGNADNFLNGDEDVKQRLNQDGVSFTGKISDEELIKFISKARFLISPSYYEGFGLTPLEALYLGTKPIISDIEVFQEVYSDLPVEFFKTGDSNDLKDKIINSNSEIEFDEDKANEKFSYVNYAKRIEEVF